MKHAGGSKLDHGKPPMELLGAYALEEVAKVLDFGRKKYAQHNWRKGISIGRLLGAALRHIFAYMRGEDVDAETGLSHMAHAMCCCMFIIWTARERPDLDDRWRGNREEEHHQIGKALSLCAGAALHDNGPHGDGGTRASPPAGWPPRNGDEGQR